MLIVKIIIASILYLSSVAAAYYFIARHCQDYLQTFFLAIIWPITAICQTIITIGSIGLKKLDDTHTVIWNKAVRERRTIEAERRLTAGAKEEVERNLEWELR